MYTDTHSEPVKIITQHCISQVFTLSKLHIIGRYFVNVLDAYNLDLVLNELVFCSLDILCYVLRKLIIKLINRK